MKLRTFIAVAVIAALAACSSSYKATDYCGNNNDQHNCRSSNWYTDCVYDSIPKCYERGVVLNTTPGYGSHRLGTGRVDNDGCR